MPVGNILSKNEFSMFLFDGVLAEWLFGDNYIHFANNVDTTNPPDCDSLSAPSDSQTGTTSSDNGKLHQHIKITITMFHTGKASTSISRTVSVEAVRQHVQPIPENPHGPVIQKVFADIRKKNANFTLMQSGKELSTDLKVTNVSG